MKLSKISLLSPLPPLQAILCLKLS